MDSKEFFALVVKVRNLQRKRERIRDRDPHTRRECIAAENELDKEIRRVDTVMREKAMPRFFDIDEINNL